MESERRLFIKKATLFSRVIATSLLTGLPFSAEARSELFSKQERDELSPAEVIEMIKSGNDRFRKCEKPEHDFLSQTQKRINAAQYPVAVILGCIDSRTPAETAHRYGHR